MVDRVDPARTGVRAGRVVGLLTAGLAVLSLVQARGSVYEATATIAGLLGVDSGLPVSILFWGNVVVAASTRYAVGYVVGSLVGVVYDWLDDPGVPGLVMIVLVVGAVDGVYATLDTQSLAIGGAYMVAWLCYVPVFVWLFDEDGDDRTGPRRLGES
jgi:hypothetical protein